MDEASQSAPQPPAAAARVLDKTPGPARRDRWLAWLALAAIVVIYGLRHLADHWWVAACGTAWSLHAGLLLAAACLIRIRKAPRAAAMAVLLFGGLAYQRWAAIPMLDRAPSGNDLRVTVANQGYWNDDPGVAPALLANDPHLLVVIETSRATEDALTAARTWGGAYSTLQQRHAFGWACYAAWPLRAEAIPGCIPGMAMLVHVDRPQAPFRVIVMHPPPPLGSEAHAEHRRLLHAIGTMVGTSSLPTLVLGDANATAEVPALRRLGAAGLRRASPVLSGSWPSIAGPFGMGIDHILATSGSWKLVDAGTVRLSGSDHRGRTATLLDVP